MGSGTRGSIAREEEESKVEREMAGQCGSWYEGEGADGEEVNECHREKQYTSAHESMHTHMRAHIHAPAKHTHSLI